MTEIGYNCTRIELCQLMHRIQACLQHFIFCLYVYLFDIIGNYSFLVNYSDILHKRFMCSNEAKSQYLYLYRKPLSDVISVLTSSLLPFTGIYWSLFGSQLANAMQLL